MTMAAKPNPEQDKPVVIPLDPEAALRALLQVVPEPANGSKKAEGSKGAVRGIPNT